MIHKIIMTIGSRVIMSAANLIILLITSNIMGAEVRGQISLFVLNISVLSLISGVFSGPGLVYLAPRKDSRSLLLVAYIWSIITVLLGTTVIHYNHISSDEPFWVLFSIGLVECLLGAHLMKLLGDENIRSHNKIQAFKPIATLSALIGLLYFKPQYGYFNMFLIAYGSGVVLSFLGSLFVMISSERKKDDWDIRGVISEGWHHGRWIQLGNIAQLLNYRISYYFLEILSGVSSAALIRIGIFSAAMQIAESIWILARSVATVQYSRISNEPNSEKSLSVSLQLIKFNYSVTILACLVLSLMPKSVFTFLLGPEFTSTKTLVLILIPGIIALSTANGISHHFAGTGQNHHNAIAAFLALFTSVGVGYLAVFYFSIWGAAIATSITYVFQASFLAFKFRRMYALNLSEMMVDATDFRTGWKKLFRQKP